MNKMLVFQNYIFTMKKPQTFWHMLGYETIQKDGRKLAIEPVQKRINENNTISIQMHATLKLSSKPTIKNKIILFPTSEMDALVNALRYYSQLISIAEVEKVSLSVPHPSRGFIPETDDEKIYLDSSKGYEISFDAHMIMRENFFQSVYTDQLLDRQDGVRIMSNVNAIDTPLPKFKELIRLFENAFAESSDKLANLLNEFLKTATSAKYDSKEVFSWMVKNRHGATHADLKKTPFLIHDEDVSPDIDRILQAGYDVLLNKEKWHDPSTVRRNLTVPVSVINKTGIVVHSDLIKNSGISITDKDRPFYAISENESELISSTFTPPSNWWNKTVPKTSQIT